MKEPSKQSLSHPLCPKHLLLVRPQLGPGAQRTACHSRWTMSTQRVCAGRVMRDSQGRLPGRGDPKPGLRYEWEVTRREGSSRSQGSTAIQGPGRCCTMCVVETALHVGLLWTEPFQGSPPCESAGSPVPAAEAAAAAFSQPVVHHSLTLRGGEGSDRQQTR